jgi:membrane protease YdiL (CAAX protease family)
MLSIGLLFMPDLVRELLHRIEPFASNAVWLELACGTTAIVSVSPLLALAGAGRGEERAGERVLQDATPRAIGRFLLAFVPFILLQWCVLWAARLFHAHVPAQTPLLDFYKSDAATRAAIFFSVAVAAPIAEEAVFRGTLQPAVARWVGADLARVSIAVLFGSLHGEIAAIPIGVFGYFLSRLRDAWGSVIPCIAVHAVNNGLALLFFAWCPYVRDLYSPG